MILWNKIADTTVANSVSELTMLDTGLGSKILNPDFFLAGKVLEFTLRGYYTTILTPTLTFKLKLGTTILVNTTAILLTTVASAKAWSFSGALICRTTGASGTISVLGKASWSTLTLDTLGWENATGVVVVDTTAAQTVDLTAQWDTASATNTLTSTAGAIEVVE